MKLKKEWLIKWLDARFGHRDYWDLSREWKEKHFESVANEILSMDMIAEILGDEINA